ncbi:MAG: LptF/LptG family permease [Marinilabiliaceae bacterium]|nr:LptF/LptG family permease [Marinilabiliaceae bacterium]
MKKLHTFIIKSFFGPLTATFFISLFILVMQFLWKYVDDLVGKGLDWIILTKLLIYASLGVIPMALPLAVLLASLMTFGNLGENYELTALKSAGISLPKIMAPLIIIILIISYLAFRFSNDVLPVANLKLATLMTNVKMTKPELEIKERIFYNGLSNFSIKIDKKNRKNDLLEGVMIYDHSDRRDKNSNITIADSGRLQITQDKKFMKLTLYNGIKYDEKADVNFSQTKKRHNNNTDILKFRTDKFNKQTSYFQLEGFGIAQSDESIHKGRDRMKNLTQLNNDIDSIRKIQEKLSSDLNKRVKRSYFQTTHRPAKDKQKADYDNIDSATIKNSDSIFSQFPLKQKRIIYETAIRNAREMKQLIEDNSRFISKEDSQAIRHEMEKHRKFTLAFACVVFFFIGAPLGSIIRKGGLGLPVVISILFFIFYYIINTMGEKLAREGLWITYQGMWLSSFILFFIGVFLTYKSTNDSSLLNTDAYYILINKIFKKKNKTTNKTK